MKENPYTESEWYESGKYGKVAVSAQGGLAAKIFHNQIERGLSSKDFFPNVLEIGALSGEHLPYVKHGFDTWTLCDVVQPKESEFHDARIKFVQQDVHDLTFSNGEFDRVASTCVLHHVNNPMLAMENMRRVCKDGGLISIFLPIDPGWMYEFAINSTSLRRAKKMGLHDEAKRSRAIGHRNHFNSLRWQIEEVFKNDFIQTKWWPIPFKKRSMNMFSSWQIRKAAGTDIEESQMKMDR